MILLFGTRASQVLMTIVTFVCNYCGQAAPQHVVKVSNKFTLFFIPLFSVGTQYIVECSNCGGVTELSREQAERSVAFAANSGGAGGTPVDYRPM